MKVLSIGNSFSQDAQRYLCRLAQAAGVQLETANLVIGGCSLERHYHNIQQDLAEYGLEQNGEATEQKISVSQALALADWDVVTLQQVSHLSFDFATYQPFLGELSIYVRKRAPRAAQWIHQTWGYEDGGEPLANLGRYETCVQMFADIQAAYAQAAQAIGAAGTIPSGAAMEAARKNGAPRLYRDGFHASLGAGRYLLGCVWLEALTGVRPQGNPFDGTDEPLSSRERALLARCAHEAVSSLAR